MMRSMLGLLVLALPAVAQQPAPAGEGAALFSAPESQACALARDAMAYLRAGRTDWRALDLVRVAGYVVCRATPDRAGGWAFEDVSGDPARHWAAGEGLLYVVPLDDDAATRRIFCVRGDGVAAFSDNAVGLTLRGERRAAADGALGDGGQGTLRDFPRTPQRGRDGNFWQPLSMLPMHELRLMVVDEQGAPMAMAELACAPAEPAFAVDAPLAAGVVRTTFEGDATLAGAAARGLGFVIRQGTIEVAIASAHVEVNGRSVRVTVPRTALRQARINANESAAIATLKNIGSAQAQCQASGVIDQNKNGQGEYGTFAELAGVAVVRGGNRTITPPVLSRALANVADGVVVRSGYCFRMFLPGKDAAAIGENAKGGAAGLAIDPGQAEVLWCAYAWPLEVGETGQRAFFINQGGDVLGTQNVDSAYSGQQELPDPEAAFHGDSDGKMSAKIGANAVGRDGQRWSVIG